MAHHGDRIFLASVYRARVNGLMQNTYNEHTRYEELADTKHTDTGDIFENNKATPTGRRSFGHSAF